MTLFLKILNMSLLSCPVVLIVLVLRWLLKKAPKWTAVLLWGLVAVRLICPFSIESALSLLPSAEIVASTGENGVPVIRSGIEPLDQGAASLLEPSAAPDQSTNVKVLQVLPVLWCCGVLAMLGYLVFSSLRVRKLTLTAVRREGNVYRIDGTGSPFVFGLFRPRIFVPFSFPERDLDYVVAHEQAHLRRGDHWWKPLGFLILSVYWFNPLLWIGYVLLCRDIELACDEKVVRSFDENGKTDYSQALLSASLQRKTITACPLAFGEVGVKERVKNVLNYKKPALWIIVTALVLCAAVAACFLTDPSSRPLKEIEGKEIPIFSSSSVTAMISSDSVSYRYLGAVNKDLVDRLSELRVSRKAIANESGEAYTVVLIAPEADTDLRSSSVPGTKIRFSSDFSAVWVEDENGSSPAYRVKKPDEARCLYEEFDRVPTPDNGRLDALRSLYPQYFGLSEKGELYVCVWQFAQDSYSCVLTDREADTSSDTSLFFLPGLTPEDMRLILQTYPVRREKIHLCPVVNPLSSYLYTIDDAYREKLERDFWNE